jgi:hypothetical protein
MVPRMLWMFAMAGGVGLLLGGLCLRLPSVLVASVALVLLGIVLMPLAQWSLPAAGAFLFALLGALQCGYLAGLMLSWSPTRRLS